MATNRTKLTPAAGGVAYNPGDLFHMPNQGDYGRRQRDYHVGIDYAAKAGTPIPAASTGEVVYSGPAGGFHYAVVVKSTGQDGKIYYSTYGHVDPEGALAPGTRISAGETVGAVGSVHADEGEKSSGPHEHFGVVTQDAIDAYNRKYGTRVSVTPNGGVSGGIGFSTGQTELFENPNKFTSYSDGAPYNARTYIPIRDGLTPRPIPDLAQSQEANRLISEGNTVSRAGISPEELSRFYAASGNPAPDQIASISNRALRVVTPDGVASGPAASGFPRDGLPTPPSGCSEVYRLRMRRSFQSRRLQTAQRILSLHKARRIAQRRKAAGDRKLPTA